LWPLLYSRSRPPRGPPAFPTRRSSDLAAVQELARAGARCVSLGLDAADAAVHDGERGETGSFARTLDAARWVREAGLDLRILTRSEEHTSELQSRENLVCRLLLEKKKN